MDCRWGGTRYWFGYNDYLADDSVMKEKVMLVLATGVMVAIVIAIIGDYVVSAIETNVTREAVDVSSDVMTLVQTALGGVIGIIGGYFGAKGIKDKDNG